MTNQVGSVSQGREFVAASTPAVSGPRRSRPSPQPEWRWDHCGHRIRFRIVSMDTRQWTKHPSLSDPIHHCSQDFAYGRKWLEKFNINGSGTRRLPQTTMIPSAERPPKPKTPQTTTGRSNLPTKFLGRNLNMSAAGPRGRRAGLPLSQHPYIPNQESGRKGNEVMCHRDSGK